MMREESGEVDELLRSAAAGDEQALDELFERYRSRLKKAGEFAGAWETTFCGRCSPCRLIARPANSPARQCHPRCCCQ
jgi:hypothetical protein